MIDIETIFSRKVVKKYPIITVMVMVRVQYCVVKVGVWRATPQYFQASVGSSVCRLLGWPPCLLVGSPAALQAAQIAEWYVRKHSCNKTMRLRERADWRLE